MKEVDPQSDTPSSWTPAGYVAALFRIAPEQRSLSLRYGVAAAVTLAALLLTAIGAPITGSFPLVLPFAAVMISAWYGGFGPGLLAAVAGALIGAGLQDAPNAPARLAMLSTLLQIGVFALSSTIIGMRFGLLHDAFARAARDSRLREDAERRAEALEEEARSSREELQDIRRRLVSMTSNSELLTSTLNYQTVLESLGRQAVSGLAHWAVVDMYSVGNEVRRLVVAHRDPQWQEISGALYEFAPDPRSNHPVARVLYSGQPELANSESVDSLMVNLEQEERRVVERLGLHSYIIVPLITRGKILGALTLVSSDASIEYRREDLTLAQDLAYRAALAIDNAQLYRAAQEELTDRRQAQAALSRQQVRINALNERLQRAMTETHHRVKNNLQIVAGMIELRLFEAGETVPAEELRRLGSYVLTLAAVHDILTQHAKEDADAEHVSAKAVLTKLLDLMRHTAGNSQLQWSLEDVLIPVRKGTALAILSNELVSNGLKHGRGEVVVQLTVNQGVARLTVQDNGPGFPDGFDPLRAANTGLELVESLGRSDLNGSTDYKTVPGAGGLVTVTFPVAYEE